MHSLGRLFSALVVVACALFLLANPVFIPYLIGLGAIGFAVSFIGRRLPPGGAPWFNASLILLGSLGGGLLLTVTSQSASGGWWWGFVVMSVVVGAVVALVSWFFNWPDVNGGAVILLGFLVSGALATAFINVAFAQLLLLRLPGVQLDFEGLAGASLIIGAIFGFGSCFLQRIFGFNPKTKRI